MVGKPGEALPPPHSALRVRRAAVREGHVRGLHGARAGGQATAWAVVRCIHTGGDVPGVTWLFRLSMEKSALACGRVAVPPPTWREKDIDL